MTAPDIRWQQRLASYRLALAHLTEAVATLHARPLSMLEQQGLIKAFEFTHELAWNLLKDFFEDQGTSNIMGSRDATRLAFARGVITDGEGWMEMIKSRNQTAHTYNQPTASEIIGKVDARYHALFLALAETMQALADGR